MQNSQNKPSQVLERGQLWKIERGYIYIAELGKRLIHYRMLKKPEQRAALTRLVGIDELMTFLRRSQAQLIS
jgi:hypothetical protein